MNGFPDLTTILIIASILTFIGALVAARYRRSLWLRLSSKPPPVVDDQGEDVKERLDRALEQQHAASEELQEIIKKVLAENDRLRRHHAGGRPYAP